MSKIRNICIVVIMSLMLVLPNTMVFAVDTVTSSENSANETITIDKVTGIDIQVNKNEVEIGWNSVKGADGYQVEFTVPNFNTKWTYDWEYIGIRFPSFPNGFGYILEIKAYKNVNGKKVYGKASDAISFNVPKLDEQSLTTPKQVEGVKVVVEDRDVTVNWDNMENVVGYEVVFDVPNTDIKWEYIVYSNMIKFKNFPINSGYAVKIRAFNIKNGDEQYGEYSAVKKFDVKKKQVTPTTKIEKVTDIKTKINGNRLELKWKDMDGVDGYDVIFSLSNSKTQWQYDWQYSTMIFNNFPTRDAYKVKVRAYRIVNNEKQYGDYSDEISFDIK